MHVRSPWKLAESGVIRYCVIAISTVKDIIYRFALSLLLTIQVKVFKVTFVGSSLSLPVTLITIVLFALPKFSF